MELSRNVECTVTGQVFPLGLQKKVRAMKLKQCSFVAYGLIGAMSIGLIAGCSTANQPGEAEFNTAMNACQRMNQVDERDLCVNNAMMKYHTAINEGMATTASCPKSTC